MEAVAEQSFDNGGNSESRDDEDDVETPVMRSSEWIVNTN